MARKRKTYEGLSRLVKPLNSSEISGAEKYSITPIGILLFALKEAYGMKVTDCFGNFDKFEAILLAGLSSLVTGGTDATLFGRDFNDFVKGYVNILNLCGKMKTVLDENGIEFDIDNPDEGEKDK